MIRQLNTVKKQIEKGEIDTATVSDLIDAVEEHLRDLSKLTVGGSEFHRDPDRCIAYIKEQYDKHSRVWKEFVTLKKKMKGIK